MRGVILSGCSRRWLRVSDTSDCVSHSYDHSYTSILCITYMHVRYVTLCEACPTCMTSLKLVDKHCVTQYTVCSASMNFSGALTDYAHCIIVLHFVKLS